MHDTFLILAGVVFLAIIFDFVNGFHDTANSIATVVSTRVLSPRAAVLMAAFFNFLGAFISTAVAKTIGSGIVNPADTTQIVVISALTGAIIWNLLTWYLGIPSSSSHALIGGLVGAVLASSGYTVINFYGLLVKVILPLIISPVIGIGTGFIVMVTLTWLFYKSTPDTVNKYFRKLQLISAGFMALSHGSNDAQKSMGIITMSLVSYGAMSEFKVPLWVILACAGGMALGTAVGGWRIIRTMGSKIIKLTPIHGFAAETSASAIILAASHLGLPVSTTHVISGCIMGVGASKRLSAVRWGVAGNIVAAWILTIPATMILSGLCFAILHLLIK